MKKVFLLFLLSIFLFSCSSSSDEDKVTWLTIHDWINFELSIPTNWNIITKESNILPNPKNSQIELAVSSDELKYGFSNNLLILWQKLDKKVTSLDFSLLNNVWSTKEYLEYLKLESKNIEFADGDKSNLYIFEAKYNTTTPKFKYLQVWKVCNQVKWYLLTIALSSDIKDTTKYEEVLKTFKCK